ncbi:Chitinase 4 [Aspergillus melleus]|uniref:Chitinase 4 n=1 Tax=Aspergillus melleus TaxID=138277 RepID=UPI001E8E8B41|nr:Chitinase 4 [Aspergillus melleus]KAH8431684.1 Chitinase 4 [Aspergillus melleus]
MPIDKLTHVFYAFANIRSDGQVYLTDEWADVQKHFEADSWNESNATARAYGCINQINKMKKSNRNLKALLSIGGWTYSANFEGPASSTTGRRRLAKSAIKLMQDIGFDGIDIDWEYPTDDNQARNLVSLLQELRSVRM